MKRFALTFTLSLSLGAVLMLMATRPVAGQDHTFAYSSHEDVSQAQGILEHLKLLAPNSYKSGELDGPTTGALLGFQHDHNLRPTGEVDWETMTQLLSHRPSACRLA